MHHEILEPDQERIALMPRQKLTGLVCFMCVAFTACSLLGISNRISDIDLTDIDAHYQALADQHDFSGALLIAQGDEIRLSEGYGFANIEEEASNTPQTSFYIGSLTKQFTAAAILILHLRGEFALSDPVCDHLPDCPDHWQDITFHHLLTHTSGMPDLRALYDHQNVTDVQYQLDEVVGWFMDIPLDFPPGDHFAYSNTGYLVLGYLVEEVSGQSYDSFLR
jgi:CubicO group peptidase (beta-lactamase class C family)